MVNGPNATEQRETSYRKDRSSQLIERHSKSLIFVVLSLLTFSMLVCLRMPEIVIKGRFWAEEGNIFFQQAWVTPPLRAIFTSYAGYLNIFATAATVAARWLLPLSLAPYLTVMVGLLVQLCPPLLILTARDQWLQSRYVRWIGCLLILFIPGSEEVWLQTLHCQFELTLCCAIILAVDLASGWSAIFQLVLLLLAPLAGPGSIALLPLFLIRAYVDKSRARFVQAAQLGIGSAIQLLFFFHSETLRTYALSPSMLLSIVTVRHIVIPFLGTTYSGPICAAVRAQLVAGQAPLWATLSSLIVFLIGAAVAIKRSRSAFWFCCASGLVATATYFGALRGPITLLDSVKAAGRYIFVPQALIGLFALGLAVTSKKWISTVSWVVVAWLLTVGAWEYWHPWDFVSDGPSWRQEVTLWQADPRHDLRIWPVTERPWTVTLDPQHRKTSFHQ